MPAAMWKASMFFGFAAVLFAQEPKGKAHPDWNPTSAASYLDSRMTWWMSWPSAARDHETFCISCHTALPYAMARPSLRSGLGETAPSAIEQKLLQNVTKRVQLWDEVAPFYPDKKENDPKTMESRGTESILNALILASYHSPETGLALDHMWAQQITEGEAKGAWPWLQFHNSPWEGDSQFYGTTLAALAIGRAPAELQNKPEIQGKLHMLREYLKENRKSQTLMDQVVLLWASTRLPGILTADEQKAVASEAMKKQQDDGGWSLSGFVGNWKRRDNTPLESKSDGYATGMVCMVVKQTGLPQFEPQLERGLAWLRGNQEPTDGRWLAYSLNKQRDLTSDVGRFMSDAATAYSVLALQAGTR